MDDDIDPLTTTSEIPQVITHRRLLIEMAGVIVVGTLVGTIFVNFKFGAGVLVGGAGSYANYFWQRNSTRAIFASAIAGRPPVFLAARYLLRYLAIGLFTAFFYYTSLLPIAAIILGLASFALAVMIEGIMSIFKSSNNQES